MSRLYQTTLGLVLAGTLGVCYFSVEYYVFLSGDGSELMYEENGAEMLADFLKHRKHLEGIAESGTERAAHEYLLREISLVKKKQEDIIDRQYEFGKAVFGVIFSFFIALLG